MRKTKIICTLGPSTKKDGILRELMLNGMNTARINFSHGTREGHLETINEVKKMREELGLPVAILLDTSGPEIRLGNFKEGKAELHEGGLFTLTSREVEGTGSEASITYKGLPGDVGKGTIILIDDGLIKMEAEEVTDTDITCRILNGGTVSDHKGINVPNVNISMPYISEKDRLDIIFGIENDVDYIAASFVRSADDILQIRKIFEEKNCTNIKIISKIENRQGVDNIDEILEVSDGFGNSFPGLWSQKSDSLRGDSCGHRYAGRRTAEREYFSVLGYYRRPGRNLRGYQLRQVLCAGRGVDHIYQEQDGCGRRAADETLSGGGG